MGRKQINGPVKRFLLQTTLGTVLLFGCSTAHSQLFHGAPGALKACDVIKAGLDGQPSKVRCGARVYRVITQAQAVECAGWSQNCPRWEERSLLLDRSQTELRSCLVDSTEAERQATELVDMTELLRSDLEKQRRLATSRWTTLEIVGVGAISITAGLVAGFFTGLLAF